MLPLFWLCNFSPLFSPLLLRWHDHKSKQRRLCDTSSARGQLRNFGLWIGSWDPTDHVTFLPSSHPQLFTSYELKRRRKGKNKIHTVSMTWHDSYRQSKSFNWPVARSTEVFFIFCPLFCGLFDWRRSRKLARNRLAINWKNWKIRSLKVSF